MGIASEKCFFDKQALFKSNGTGARYAATCTSPVRFNCKEKAPSGRREYVQYKKYGCYLLVAIATVVGACILRFRAIGYYAHASSLRACLNCGHVTSAQVHHLEYLGGVCDTYAVVVCLIGGLILLVALVAEFAVKGMPLPQPPDTVTVMKQVLAATRPPATTAVVEIAGLTADDEFAAIVTTAMGAGFAQASSGKYLTT